MRLLEPLRREARGTDLTGYFSWYQDILSMGANPALVQQTWTGQKAEPISDTLYGYSQGGLKGNGVVFGLERVRVKVFSQGRFMWQRLTKGRPGDLFSDPSLSMLEKPWPGGTTSDLLAMMLLDADMAGNSYVAKVGGQLTRLRPDWVEVILGDRIGGRGGLSKLGYLYWHDGRAGPGPQVFLPDEVCHFMPMTDPLFSYRGMSWLTPVVREIQADSAATTHKLKFFENAATPNLAVGLPKEISPEQFKQFVDEMDQAHQGFENAYKTLYTAGGADVTVIGADMRQLDFKVTQGAGETRLAAAAGIHPAVAGLSEGLQGASLNAGNFSAARRQTADIEFAHLWRNVAGSMETVIPPPGGSRLTIDTRDVPFLREDQKDAAEIERTKQTTITGYVQEGFTAESSVAAVAAGDVTLLEHTGRVSVQLQTPGTDDVGDTSTPPGAPDDD